MMKEIEGAFSKVLPLALITCTTIIAIAIISLREKRSTGSLYSFFTTNPDTLGLVVQVVSAALGACQVFAITSLINLTSRLRMQSGRPIEFRRLKLLAAITSGSSQALQSSLPLTWLMMVVLSVVVLKIPAALWAGALTPVLAEYVTEKGSIPVPTYAQTAVPVWQGSFRRLDNGTVDMSLNCNWTITSDRIITGSVALVSTCPAIDLVSALLGSLATAAAGTVSTPRPHPRIDSSGWTILGRSFGVGSSPGIMPLQDLEYNQAPMLAFNYTETGYLTNVTCARNATSNYTIASAAGTSGAPSYFVTGTLPNSKPGHIESYQLNSGTQDDNFLAWSALTNADQNILVVAGTGLYSRFDKMQCLVDFKPAQYVVHVNVTNSIITVHTDKSSVLPASDVEPTRQFVTSVFYSLEQISRMSGNTVVSSLGVPLDHNTHIITSRNGTLDTEATTALSLEYGVGTLLENLLVANAQSQMFNLRNMTVVPVSVRYRAVRIGSDRYIYTVLVTNCVILLVILGEVFRTKLWRGLAIFDFTDIQDMAVAASVGGSAIADRCEALRNSEGQSDQMRVRLSVYRSQWALSPDEHGQIPYEGLRQPRDAGILGVGDFKNTIVLESTTYVGSGAEQCLIRQ